MDWHEAQEWEKEWHDNCVNSFNEEEKQLLYAEKIGLQRTRTHKTPYNFDLNQTSVLDIGGGAYSLLLKCINFKKVMVVDPLMDKFPHWVRSRYASAGILHIGMKGEDILVEGFDEVWIYNVLEHAEFPEKIIENAKRAGKLIRIFEWVDIPTSPGHLHTLTESKLNEWLGGEGKVEVMNTNLAKGKAYYGIFPTK